MPLTIFYRFHSTVCLCDIWKRTYKIKSEFLWPLIDIFINFNVGKFWMIFITRISIIIKFYNLVKLLLNENFFISLKLWYYKVLIFWINTYFDILKQYIRFFIILLYSLWNLLPHTFFYILYDNKNIIFAKSIVKQMKKVVFLNYYNYSLKLQQIKTKIRKIMKILTLIAFYMVSLFHISWCEVKQKLRINSLLIFINCLKTCLFNNKINKKNIWTF